MNKRNLLPQAERMYIREGKGTKEIAAALGISPATVTRWKKQRNWEERRIDYQNSAMNIAEKLLKLLATDVQNLEKLDPAAVDKIVKAVKAIRSLNQDVDMLGATIEVMEQLANFLQSRHSRLYQEFQEVLPQFLIYMREKYK